MLYRYDVRTERWSGSCYWVSNRMTNDTAKEAEHVVQSPPVTVAYLAAALGTAVFVLWTGAVGGGAPGESVSDRSPERAWVEEAERLVEAAATGRADAAVFQQRVQANRTKLRRMMPSGGAFHSEASNIMPEKRQLLSSMVVLDALLKSAAACQTRGRIVCPATLMMQLRTSLKNTYANLEAYEARLSSAAEQG